MAEFFELFKTPWEAVVPGRRYAAVLTTDPARRAFDTAVVVAYGAEAGEPDARIVHDAANAGDPVDVRWGDWTIPVYGPLARFDRPAISALPTSGGKTVGYRHRTGHSTLWRIGYDLFAEVAALLTDGQPLARAASPTLELHIALLRSVLRGSNVRFVEIPPRPRGFAFTCCLTHDIDFHGIRRHKLDRTLAGFAARASIGTVQDLARGRRSLGDALRNAGALMSLPLVFLKLRPDLWRPFDDYSDAEHGRRSTFFVVPFKGRPGRPLNGHVEPYRAVAYGASDIVPEVRQAVGRGHEVAVHGIDAWCDARAGAEERRAVASASGAASRGVRMHWLYFKKDSPRELEAAGFEYDSTWGYNDAVGYRAGTSQAFRLAGTRVMELPLTIMDSALFFPDRMGLSPEEALDRCRQLLGHVRTFGGTLVVNWHDRSLAPERLWGRTYRALLADVEASAPVWFATAGEAVAWYTWRRSISFTSAPDGSIAIAAGERHPAVPGARIVVHGADGAAGTEEIAFDGHQPVEVEL